MTYTANSNVIFDFTVEVEVRFSELFFYNVCLIFLVVFLLVSLLLLSHAVENLVTVYIL